MIELLNMASNFGESTVLSDSNSFIYYPHIDKLKQNDFCKEFIANNDFRIFPKLDGANCQINYDSTSGTLTFGSSFRTEIFCVKFFN